MDFSSIKDFLTDPIYWKILYLTLIVFFAGWFIWYMYIKLSQKDLFKLNHISYEEAESTWEYVAYVLKYIFLFPVFVFLWFVLFVACLALLSHSKDLTNIMIIGVVLVSVIRISAYASQRMAEDIAKLLPLTVLAGLILNPSFITLNLNFSVLNELIPQIPSFLKYLLFIVVLELLLKAGHGIRMKLVNNKRSQKE